MKPTDPLFIIIALFVMAITGITSSDVKLPTKEKEAKMMVDNIEESLFFKLIKVLLYITWFVAVCFGLIMWYET